MCKCTNIHCENGYYFDTNYPCNVCDKGKAIQNKYDKDELKSIMKKANTLRTRIKAYKMT